MKLYTQQFLIILFFIPVWMNAQVFPVQVTPQVLPPYSLKLSEYGTSDSEKLILNLLFTDITESNVQVRLKFFLENNAGLSIQSNDFVTGANPIFLDGGIPLRLTNIDLQAYFSLQNLLGISPQQYNTPLPEGLYNFCFEVYDVFSDRRISRKSCVPVYLVLNDPPFLNLPGRGEQVLLREPQNIIFQWTPRHLNATNVSYEFTLTELWDTQMDPQASFLAGRPLYQTNTFATTLLYGPAETPLLPDKMYGWRVRALVSDGISETSVFKNNGFSEIYYFTYTGSCAEPESILAEAKNNTTEKIYWQGVDHKLYDIQYRKKTSSASGKKNSSEGNMWFNAGTQNEYTTIYNLKPGTTYEFRVGGQCIENGPYTYSQIYEFTTTLPIDDNDSTYNCGITPEILITNQESIQQLVVNETFTAGDFPVTIKEITQGNDVYTATIPEEPDEDSEENNDSIDEALPSGIQDKTFSGWGYIVVPYLNDTKIKVSFENIKINTDYQLIDGMVETDYDKNWGGLASVNEILDVFEGDNDLRNINLDYDITIDNISIADDGTIEITHPISGAIRREPGGDDVTIMDTNPDGSRDIFHVDADGNIREGGQMAPGGPIRSQNTAGVNSNGEVTELTAKGVKVEFLEYTDYTYGFDRIPNGQETKLGKYYKQIKDTEGNPYNIINKSVGNGDEDIIRAKVTITDNSLSVHDLVIKTIHGEKVDYDVSGNEITLKLKGYYTFEHENIYATIQPKKNKTSKQTVAGVFSQWHLANKDVNVTIIPVNGASLPNSDVLGSQINKIFKQASVTFNVSVAPEMSIAKSQIGVGESGALSNYTSDQKDIINQFKSSGVTNRKSYYVFVFGDGIRPSRPSVAGFMPLKRQFGFVFSSNLSQKEEGKSSLAGTLAHELGHGAFALQHPFKKLGTTTSGTDWLMDYGNGKRLSHIDWSQIHNPEFRLYLFQDGEDGASLFSALTPNWKPFTYTGDGFVSFTNGIPQYNGAVYEIIVNDKKYVWNDELGINGHYEYQGEKLAGTYMKEVYAVEEGARLNEASEEMMIQLYWNKGNCEENELYNTTWGYIENRKGNLNLNNGIPNGVQLIGLSGCNNSGDFCEGIGREQIQQEINEITEMRFTIVVDDLVEKINETTICALRGLDYTLIRDFLKALVVLERFDNDTEKAIVMLMESIAEDSSASFYVDFIQKDNGVILRKLLEELTNASFLGLIGDNNFNNFIATLSTLTANLSDDASKWYVFNAIVKAKYAELGSNTIPIGLQMIMASMSSVENDDQLNVIPVIIRLFIDMSEDPYLREVRLDSYKLLYDIATARYYNKEDFASYTMTDYIEIPSIGTERTPYKIISAINNRISWVFPSAGRYNIRDSSHNIFPFLITKDDLNNTFFWSKYLTDNNMSIDKLNKNPNIFLSAFYIQFLEKINIEQEDNSEFWENIQSVTCDNIGNIIKHINSHESSQSLEAVPELIKLQVLKSYFVCDGIVEIDEESHLIEETKTALGKLLASFDPTTQTVFPTIEKDIGLKKIYDVLIVGSNKDFYEFVVWLSMQIMNSGKASDLNWSEAEAMAAYQDPSRLLSLGDDLFTWPSFYSKINNDNTFKSGNDDIMYNQLVAVYAVDNFTFAGQSFERGTILKIPMIQAFAMSKSNRNVFYGKAAWLAADIAFFAFGVAQFRALYQVGKYVRAGIAASDIVGSSAGAIATALNDNAISEDLRYKIQILSIVASAPSLLTIYRDSGFLSETNSAINSARIGDSEKDLLRSLYNTSGTRLSNIPDGYEEAFRIDFGSVGIAEDLGEDFIRAWKNYRDDLGVGNSVNKICN